MVWGTLEWALWPHIFSLSSELSFLETIWILPDPHILSVIMVYWPCSMYNFGTVLTIYPFSNNFHCHWPSQLKQLKQGPSRPPYFLSSPLVHPTFYWQNYTSEPPFWSCYTSLVKTIAGFSFPGVVIKIHLFISLFVLRFPFNRGILLSRKILGT